MTRAKLLIQMMLYSLDFDSTVKNAVEDDKVFVIHNTYEDDYKRIHIEKRQKIPKPPKFLNKLNSKGRK